MLILLFLGLSLAASAEGVAVLPPPSVEALAGARGDAAPLPPADTVIHRIAFGSCINQDAPIPALNAVIEREARLMVMLGDNVYGDADSGDPSLPELRHAYESLANNAHFRSLSARIPVLSVWDDHDYAANDGGADFAFKAEAERVFEGFWGIRSDDPRGQREGVYGSYSFGPLGQRIQIIMLDTRTHRSELTRIGKGQFWRKGRYTPSHDHRQTMLGQDQWAWLSGALNEPADLRIVVSSIQVLPERHGWERWGQLPMERAKLIDMLHRRENVVVVSGDRHWSTMYKNDFGLTELTTSSLNRPGRASFPEKDVWRVRPPVIEANFGEVDVDWEKRTAMLRIINADGVSVSELPFGF